MVSPPGSEPREEPELARLRANVWKLSLLGASHMFLLVMPIVVPFFRSHGLGMRDVYTLEAIFSVGVVVLEVPSGYVADLVGRRRSLLLGAALYGVAFTFLAFSDSFLSFAVFELLAAAGIAFFSGADLALLYASLERLPDGAARSTGALGRLVSFTQLGETVAALAGGALAAVSLALPVQLQALVAWLPLGIAFSLYEPSDASLASREHGENARAVLRALFGSGRRMALLALANVGFGVVTLVAVWALQGQWQSEGISIEHFGWMWAVQNGTVALAARFAHRLDDALGIVVVALLVSALPLLGYAGMAWAPGAFAIAAGLAFPLTRALNYVVLRDALNLGLPSELRATANSLLALGLRGAFVVLGPAFGALVDARSMRRACEVALAGSLLLALGLGLPLAHALRRQPAARATGG